MGSGSNNPTASDDDGPKTGHSGKGPGSAEPAPRTGSDELKRGRDNSATEADEWLAGGAEEAGYGYGV